MDGQSAAAQPEAGTHRSARMDFTLIELLVVVTIIALLISILLPALHNAQEQARGSYCMNNQRQLAIAAMAFASEHDDHLQMTTLLRQDSGDRYERLDPPQHTKYEYYQRGSDSISWAWPSAYLKYIRYDSFPDRRGLRGWRAPLRERALVCPVTSADTPEEDPP